MLITGMGTLQKTPSLKLSDYLLRDPLFGTGYFCLYDNDQMKETVIFFF